MSRNCWLCSNHGVVSKAATGGRMTCPECGGAHHTPLYKRKLDDTPRWRRRRR